MYHCIIFKQTIYALKKGTARFSDGNQRTSRSDQPQRRGRSEISKESARVSVQEGEVGHIATVLLHS